MLETGIYRESMESSPVLVDLRYLPFITPLHLQSYLTRIELKKLIFGSLSRDFCTLSQHLAQFLSFWNTFPYFLSFQHTLPFSLNFFHIFSYFLSGWHTFLTFSTLSQYLAHFPSVLHTFSAFGTLSQLLTCASVYSLTALMIATKRFMKLF